MRYMKITVICLYPNGELTFQVLNKRRDEDHPYFICFLHPKTHDDSVWTSVKSTILVHGKVFQGRYLMRASMLDRGPLVTDDNRCIQQLQPKLSIFPFFLRQVTDQTLNNGTRLYTDPFPRPRLCDMSCSLMEGRQRPAQKGVLASGTYL